MRYKKMIRTLALTLFSSLFLLSAAVVISYLGESRAQEAAFDELEELAAEAETSAAPAPTGDSDAGRQNRPPCFRGMLYCMRKTPTCSAGYRSRRQSASCLAAIDTAYERKTVNGRQ